MHFHALALEAIDHIPAAEREPRMDAFVRYEEPVVELVLISGRYGHLRELYERRVQGDGLTLTRHADQADVHFESVRRKTQEFLAARKLVGTRLRVRWPRVTPVRLEVQVQIPEFYRPGRVLESVGEKLLQEFDVLQSAAAAQQAYNQPIQYSRLQGCMEDVPGVAAVRTLRIDYEAENETAPDAANDWYVPIRGLVRVTQLHLRRAPEARHV